MKYLKTLGIYLFLFNLFYFGPIQVGPITFSQLWKTLFWGLLVISVLSIENRTVPTFLSLSYLRGYKNLVNGGLFGNFFPDILSFVRYMMFPLMVNFFKASIKSIKKLETITVGFAYFIILSGIPFIFGLLDPLGREITIGSLLEGYIGIFQVPHAASTATAISLIVILFYLKNNKLKLHRRVFNYFLVGLGLFLLYKTFIRTGYVMFMVGVVIIYLPKKISIKRIGTWFSVIISIGAIFIYLLNTNQVFYNRIFDITPGVEEINYGSGRLGLWETSVQIWLDSNIIEKIFGQGWVNLTDGIEKYHGRDIAAHSEFFNQLVQNGIIGLLILFGFLISIYRFIRSKSGLPSYRLSLAIFLLYLSFLTVQGGMNFFVELFFALVIVRLMMEGD